MVYVDGVLGFVGEVVSFCLVFAGSMNIVAGGCLCFLFGFLVSGHKGVLEYLAWWAGSARPCKNSSLASI